MREEIDRLLQKHSMLTPVQRCGYHWVPENKTLDWLLGFLQCLEVCEGVQQLFAQEKQPEAYAILQNRVREELAKFAEEQTDD